MDFFFWEFRGMDNWGGYLCNIAELSRSASDLNGVTSIVYYEYYSWHVVESHSVKYYYNLWRGYYYDIYSCFKYWRKRVVITHAENFNMSIQSGSFPWPKRIQQADCDVIKKQNFLTIDSSSGLGEIWR